MTYDDNVKKFADGFDFKDAEVIMTMPEYAAVMAFPRILKEIAEKGLSGEEPEDAYKALEKIVEYCTEEE